MTYTPDVALALELGPDLELALAMADAADLITMDRFGSLDLVVETKPDLTPVTEADKATEVALRAMLAELRPGDSVLGEEFGTSDGSAARRWIIVVGVVSAPALARRWWAASGSGAWGRMLDHEPVRLQVSLVRSLNDASLSYSDAGGWSALTATGLESLLNTTWRQRAYGDFWSHILVAEGAVDVAAEPALGPWDIAAIIPIVTEAGGRITAFDGRPALEGGCAVTTNGALHEAVLHLLRGG